MVPVQLEAFYTRLRQWRLMPDRRVVETRDDRGRPVTEWWAVGVCRARRVRIGPWMELYADRGGHVPKHDPGKISFKTWDNWKPPVREVPVPPEVPDWAE